MTYNLLKLSAGLGKLVINMLFEKFGCMWVSFKSLWKVKAVPQDEDLRYDVT